MCVHRARFDDTARPIPNQFPVINHGYNKCGGCNIQPIRNERALLSKAGYCTVGKYCAHQYTKNRLFEFCL